MHTDNIGVDYWNYLFGADLLDDYRSIETGRKFCGQYFGMG